VMMMIVCHFWMGHPYCWWWLMLSCPPLPTASLAWIATREGAPLPLRARHCLWLFSLMTTTTRWQWSLVGQHHRHPSSCRCWPPPCRRHCPFLSPRQNSIRNGARPPRRVFRHPYYVCCCCRYCWMPRFPIDAFYNGIPTRALRFLRPIEVDSRWAKSKRRRCWLSLLLRPPCQRP